LQMTIIWYNKYFPYGEHAKYYHVYEWL
jgi:hypothetical protein